MTLVIEAIIGVLVGFLFSFNITNQLLRSRELRILEAQLRIIEKNKKDKQKSIMKKNYLDDVTHNKNNSKIRFSNVVRYRVIPSVLDLSSNTLNKLWYEDKDYKEFKAFKYNSL